jgi:hypothetical protein
MFAYSLVSKENNRRTERKREKIDVIFQAINVCASLYAIVPATITHIRIDVQKGKKKGARRVV